MSPFSRTLLSVHLSELGCLFHFLPPHPPPPFHYSVEWSPARQSINPTQTLSCFSFLLSSLFLSVRVLRTQWGLRKASSPHRTRPSPLLPLRHPRTACRWTSEAAVFTPQGARDKWTHRQGSLTPPQPPALSTHKWVLSHEHGAYVEVGSCLDSCPFTSGPFGSGVGGVWRD